MNLFEEINLIKKILKNYPERFILNDSISYSNYLAEDRKKKYESLLKKILIFSFHYFSSLLKTFFLAIFSNIYSNNQKLSSQKNYFESDLNLFLGTFNQYKALKDIVINFGKLNIYFPEYCNLNLPKDSKKIGKTIIKTKTRSYLIMLIFSILRFSYIKEFSEIAL